MKNDLISRSALIEKIESTDWYHISEIGTLENGANSKLHTPLFKADDIFTALENAPAVDAVPVDENLGEMLNWAVRYALGRMTYAVNDTVSYVLPLIPKLDKRTLSVMQRDIERAPEYGHDCDEADWMRLLYAIREERKRRENHDE